MHAMLKVYRPLLSLRDLMKPVLINGVQKRYGVTPQQMAKAQAEILEGQALIASRIHGDPARYLAGEQLTLADISAAALFAPLFTPAGTPWEGIAGHDAKPRPFSMNCTAGRPVAAAPLRRRPPAPQLLDGNNRLKPGFLSFGSISLARGAQQLLLQL
jgi:glutathione S-transferase